MHPWVSLSFPANDNSLKDNDVQLFPQDSICAHLWSREPTSPTKPRNLSGSWIPDLCREATRTPVQADLSSYPIGHTPYQSKPVATHSCAPKLAYHTHVECESQLITHPVIVVAVLNTRREILYPHPKHRVTATHEVIHVLDTPARGTTLQNQPRPPHQQKERGVGQGDPELTPLSSKPVNQAHRPGRTCRTNHPAPYRGHGWGKDTCSQHQY